MGIVHGCDIPEHLYYSVADSVWVDLWRDGSCAIGYAAPGCVALGEIRAYSPCRAGRFVRKGRSCATLESERWVEPARAPVAGTVVAVNEIAQSNPLVINRDPYGSGWLVRLMPDNWARDSRDLLTGGEALKAFGVARGLHAHPARTYVLYDAP